MTITRARKTPAKASRVEKAEVTPEQFIAGAGPGAPRALAAPVAASIGREQRALVLVKKYVPWAAGAGVLPMPGIDLALIMGVQMRMLAKLSAQYDVPFRESAAKSTLAALMAGLVQYSLSGHIASAFKIVPVAGPLLGIAVLPALAAASTLAIGKVFITHFESGGTFLEFDPKKVQDHFRAEFERARAGTANVAHAATS